MCGLCTGLFKRMGPRKRIEFQTRIGDLRDRGKRRQIEFENARANHLRNQTNIGHCRRITVA